jgi:BioD-like phosphotransacetylase family protein
MTTLQSTRRSIKSTILKYNSITCSQSSRPLSSATGSSCPIYVAATRQHVGKTTVSLSLLSGLQKRVDRVGFLKPVGQHSLTVSDMHSGGTGELVTVDKDVVLVKEHFGLDHVSYRYMSPVLIPPGYTKDYVDGKISSKSQQEAIQTAYTEISKTSSVVLAEGTGHCAVGSIVEAGNAKVASWIGAKMVLVANGGLGSAFDELELNRVLCEYYNVEIAGVIINKVRIDKYDQTKYYLEKALHDNWGIPLLGCIPDRPFLGCPALVDLEKLFGGTFVCGQEHALRHYTVNDLNLVTTSLDVFLESLRSRPSRTLYVCHASRNDILLAFLGEHQRRKSRDESFEAALVLCEGDQLDPHILDMLAFYDPPILVVPQATSLVMEKIHSFTPKLHAGDTTRVTATVNHYEPFIDFDLLLHQTGNTMHNNNNNNNNDANTTTTEDGTTDVVHDEHNNMVAN